MATNSETFAKVIFDFSRAQGTAEQWAVVKSAIANGTTFEEWYSRINFGGFDEADKVFAANGCNREQIWKRIYELTRIAASE